MVKFNRLICPVSTERVDENKVRITAFGVGILMGFFFITSNPVFPAILILDFYIRAFTRLKYSPLSLPGHLFISLLNTEPVWIDKAPKVFAARVGLVFSVLITASVLLDLLMLSFLFGGTLVLFAFLECGLNFCAGCWVYTYVVIPLMRRSQD